MTKGAMGVPQFGTSRQTSIRIKYREYVQDIITSGTANDFEPTTFSINPGMGTQDSDANGQSGMFPWLCNIAQNFEEYLWNGLMMQFKSTSANAVAAVSTALGEVIMATNYNPLNTGSLSPFNTPGGMLQYEFARCEKPAVSFVHGVEVRRKDNPINEFYTRTGPIPPGSDLRLYDIGAFTIAVNGFPATSAVNLGQLWVMYDITLRKPKLQLASGNSQINSDHFQLPYVICFVVFYFCVLFT